VLYVTIPQTSPSIGGELISLLPSAQSSTGCLFSNHHDAKGIDLVLAFEYPEFTNSYEKAHFFKPTWRPQFPSATTLLSFALCFGGGIPLEHCTLTDDGGRCAMEYNCVRWGESDIVLQAGVAVYERGSGGLLSAARIYDDVEPPAVSDTSAG
jgi:hypothetical protein